MSDKHFIIGVIVVIILLYFMNIFGHLSASVEPFGRGLYRGAYHGVYHPMGPRRFIRRPGIGYGPGPVYWSGVAPAYINVLGDAKYDSCVCNEDRTYCVCDDPTDAGNRKITIKSPGQGNLSTNAPVSPAAYLSNQETSGVATSAGNSLTDISSA